MDGFFSLSLFADLLTRAYSSSCVCLFTDSVASSIVSHIIVLISMQDSDNGEDSAHVPVGILTVIPEDDPTPNAADLHLHPSSVAVILEGDLVLDDLSSYPEAFCLLFGLVYALHLDYPRSMRYSFEFIQKILLDIGQNKLSPKMQTLKNALMSS